MYHAEPACGAGLEVFHVCLVDLPCADSSMHNGCDAQQDEVLDACSGGPWRRRGM